MLPKECFRVLELDEGATSAQIKGAYRRLVRQYHPDLNPDDKSAQERFHQVQEAYGVLAGSELFKRKPRRRRRASPPPQQPRRGQRISSPPKPPSWAAPSNSRGPSFTSRLASFLATLKSWLDPSHRSNGSGVTEVTIPFLDAACGTEIQLQVARPIRCLNCDGTGLTPEGSVESCPTCAGQGTVLRLRKGGDPERTECVDCRGRGKALNKKCWTCGGSGHSMKEESIRVKIPAGLLDGARLRIRHPNSTQSAQSDLYLRVNVEEDGFFSRRGNDIFCQVPLTLTEAVLGAEIEIPTLAGVAKLRVPSGTQSGQVLRLRGRGIRSDKKKPGDQLVELKVVLPRVADARSEKLLKELEQLNPQDLRSNLDRKP